jgi:hypothetical protein
MFVRAIWLAMTLVLTACAAEVVRMPVVLAARAGAPRIEMLLVPVELRLDSGYHRRLEAGTEWQEIGSISEGRVLKPLDSTLTVEGAHMHEAYAVVREESLVGFYLPVERSFSPLSVPVRLSLKERKLK